nr:putative ribonuclease H-like domain-containing protein [Tanacetum cinerariifolium]
MGEPIWNKMHKAFPLPVMEFPLPEEVPTASEESSHCQKKRDATAEKIALLLKSSSNCSASDGTGKRKGRTVTLTADDMPKRKNDVKAITTLLLSLPDEHQLRFSLETLEQMFNRLQVIVSQLQFMDVEIEHDDLNQKFLTSLAPEWLMHTIVWRNRSDLDTMRLNDLSGNEDVNIASGSTASINVSTGSANIRVTSISQETACAYIASQSSGLPEAKTEEGETTIDNGLKLKNRLPKRLAQVEARLAEHRSQELKYCEKIRVLEFKIESRANCIENLTKDLELLKKEKESTSDGAQNKNPSEASPSTISPKPFIKFVKANDSLTKSKTYKIKIAKKPPVKYAEQYRKPTKNPNGSSQNNIDDKGYWDSGCSRHMTGNISYLSDYEPFDGGYVSFGQGGCKITSQRTIKTDLTCLVAKASADECMIWHTRLGHLNFKTMNRKFITKIENLKDLKVKIIRCDNGGDFRNKEMNDFYSQKGIKREFSNARTPQQNGVAERRNKTLIKAARTMLDDAKLLVTFWAEAVNTACYVQNRVLVNKSQNKTAYELFNGRTPAIGFLKPFGCHVMILNTLDNLGKFEAKGDKGYFIGYSMSSKAFRVFNKITKRVEENLHVEFLENKAIEKGTKDATTQEVNKDVSSLRYIALPNWVHDALLESSSSKPQDDCSTDVLESSENSNPTATSTNPLADHLETLTVKTPIPTVSLLVPTACFTDSQEPSSDTRLISKRVASQVETPSLDNILTLTNQFKDILGVTTTSVDSDGVEADVSNMEKTITASPTPTLRFHKDHPKSQIIGLVDTPIQTRNKSKEVEAMQEELLQFKIQNVWTLVDCPKGVRPIGTRWVLKNKKDKRGIVIRNKARLVAQGHTQEDGIDYDEVFAPVARIEAIRLFLAYASFMGFTVYQMDVKSAFLYGTIDEEVYVMQPPGFQDLEFPAKVYKVEKAMYGLHQAPRAWHQVTPKECHLHTVKRIFRYLKSHPKLGLLYPKESPFDLVAYSDSDYGGATQDRKSTTGGYLLTKPFDAVRFQYLVCKLFPLLGKLSTVSVFLGFGLTFAGTSKYWGVLRILMISLRLIPLFWSTAKIETTEEGTKILATIDGNLRTVFESSIRRNLKLNDEVGISSLPDAELFENLTLMGYNISPNQKFTFQKGQFFHQWKYLIHTIMQCMSPKSTGFKELSSNIATALVCLATNRVYNFSKMIFDGMVKNVNNKVSKVLMYPRRARIAQSLALPPVADEPASPLRDVGEGEACPTDFGFKADQERENIAKTSTLPYESTSRVTSLAADEGSMQHKLDELTALCTSPQMQQSEMVSRGVAEHSGYDAPIKGRRLDVGEEAAERVSDDTKEMATVLTSMDAATILASRVAEVPTGSGSIPTAGPPVIGVPTGSDVVPTAGLILATAPVVTPYTRRKGKETMVESETLKKKKEEAERFKRKGIRFEQESAKKLKTSEEVPKEVKSPDKVLKEKVKEIMQLVPIEKHLDREDLNQLWRLVKESFSIMPPISDKEMELWVELKMLYEQDDEDQLWTHTQNLMHAPVE